MRISLLEGNNKPRGSSRRGNRRRNRTLDAAISQPWRRSRPKTSGSHTSPRRSRAEPEIRAEIPSDSSPIRIPGWLVVSLKKVRWSSASVLIVLLGLLVFASVDRRFFVYEAQVIGSHHLQSTAIYEASGIHEQNIFWINPQAVSQRIGQLDGIRAVQVHCALPAKVIVEVEEREPTALLRSTGQGRDLWLDEDGTVLPYHGDPTADHTVFIIDRSNQVLQVGDQVKPVYLVRWAQQIAAAVPGVRLFYYHPDRGLSFSSATEDREWMVYVGDGNDLPRKLQALGAVTEYLMAENIRPTAVDVRSPTRPVFTLLDSGVGRGSQ